MNRRLFYGDNLEVLRRHIPDDSVDLIYLDPPFNSNASYNVLFKQKDGTKAAGQLHAFHDTWEWNEESQHTYEQVIEAGGDVSRALQAFRAFLGTSDMLAYLAMMAPRLVELRRVLKDTGSIYLHCDPTASHYLKMLMDAVFSPQNFKAEVVWQRSSAHSDTSQGLKKPGRIHDTLLYYTKTNRWIFNQQFTAYEDAYVEKRFTHEDAAGPYKDADLTAAKPGGDTSYGWPVKRPARGSWTHDLDNEAAEPKQGWEYKTVFPSSGRFWAYSRENMRAFAEADRLHYFSSGTPRLKQHAETMKGIGLQDMWTDIPPINSQAQERLGYPTQKPLALLERIVSASSNEDDIVLDPFCGCGTTIDAAQKLKRQWIGIDIAEPAIQVIKKRFIDRFNMDLGVATGEPESVEDAGALAASDPYQFQWWALGLVDARPQDQKKGSDRGIDGRRYFVDPTTGKTEQIIFSVKAGHVTVDHVRVLQSVVAREKATIGVLISMEPATRPMKVDAVSAGIAVTSWGNFPKIQLITVGDLLSGKKINAPPARQIDVTYPRAPKAKPKPEMPTEQPDLAGVDLKRRMKKSGLPDPGAGHRRHVKRHA